MDPAIARSTWRTLEPIHGAIYFTPDGPTAYREVGIDDRMTGYFASRAAPMGAVVADVVVATFFNFDAAFVRARLDGVWDRVTPDVMIDARFRAVDAMFRRYAAVHLGSDELAAAAALARTAAEAASGDVHGRPLFAGHVSLPWPSEPHLVLWHAQSLLREYRGDGHIAALVGAGLNGCEALVTHAASGDVAAAVLRATRQVSDDDWAAAVDRLRSIGWLDAAGGFTPAGRAARDAIERSTDRAAVRPYEALGEDACRRLRELARPISKAMLAAFGPPA